MSKMKKIDICDFCGGEIGEYGRTICSQCGETMCVKNCIPGGVGTQCVQCEEEEHA